MSSLTLTSSGNINASKVDYIVVHGHKGEQDRQEAFFQAFSDELGPDEIIKAFKIPDMSETRELNLNEIRKELKEMEGCD